MSSNTTSVAVTLTITPPASSTTSPFSSSASSTPIMSTTTAAAPTTTSAPATTSSVDTSSILSSISSAVSSSILQTTSSAAPTTQTTPSSSAVQTTPPVSTSTISLSSLSPTTQVFTSVVTASGTTPGESATPVTIVVTQTADVSSIPTTSESSSGSRTSSTGLAQNTGGPTSQDSNGKGLSTGAVTAIAVVVPVVVVGALVLAGIFLWRKRKAKKAAEEARRKEVEDYGFNPNNDPTLPTVASENGAEMAEDNSGYRGWGAATGNSRKLSTTLTSGHTQGQLSDAGSNPYGGAGSGEGSDGNSGDAMLHPRRETMNSDQVGDLGQAPIAGTNPTGMKRGPSNASSTYSAGGHSDVSDVSPPPGSVPQSYEAYNPAAGFGYSQHGPYGDGTYGGASNPDGMPIVQDVSARRNTRIQQPGNYQQSGIAQNF